MKVTARVHEAFVSERVWLVLLGLVLGAYLLQAVPTALTGPLNPDEGIYVYGGWRVAHGELPYRDFSFHQTPLILLPHAIVQGLFGPGFYVGRITGLALGAVLIVATMHTGRAISSPHGGLFAGAFLAFLPWFVIQMTTVSAYPFVSLALVGIVHAVFFRRWFLVGLLAASAVWTRQVFALIVPLLLVGAALVAWKSGWRVLFRSCAGLTTGGLLILLPLLVLFPEKAWENLVGHHVFARQTFLEETHGGRNLLAVLPDVKAHILTEYLRVYRWPWLLAWGGFFCLLGCWKTLAVPQRRASCVAGAVVVTMAAVQAFAFGVAYDTPLLPLLALVAGTGFSSVLQRFPRWMRPRAFALGLLLFVCAGSYWPQRFLIASSVKGDPEESWRNVRRVAAYVREHSALSDRIFTPELYVAAEAGRETLNGVGLGRFFYFPEFSRERAERAGTLNTEMLQERIASREAIFIILNGKHFWRDMRSLADRTAVLQWIEGAGYRRVESLHRFLPAVENLQVYERI